MLPAVYSLLFPVLAVAGITAFLLAQHPRWGRPLVESCLNAGTKEFFEGSLRVGGFRLDRRLRIHLEGLQGNLRSEAGPIPLKIRSLESEGSVSEIFSKKGLEFSFEGFGPRDSGLRGISGRAFFKAGKDWFFNLLLDIQELDLHEIEWVNPENLSGASGKVRGNLEFGADARGKIESRGDLEVAPPGGLLQARFFDLLKPYLPEVALREKVDEISGHRGLTGFHEASLKIELARSDKMKIFLHIAVPDYNLILNLNIEVRVDEKNALGQLAGLAGVIKSKT